MSPHIMPAMPTPADAVPLASPLSKPAAPKRPRPNVRDDTAYLLPMGVFLLLTQAGAWWPKLYPIFYVARTLLVAALLALLWRHFTRIRWNHWWLGLLLGVVGIFQWVPMQLWLQNHIAFFRVEDPAAAFNPYRDIGPPALQYAFIAVRLIGAVLVVPVMEELFWRDFAWRSIIAPNDFKLAKVGEWDWRAYLIVSLIFAVVHGNWWLTSIVWGLMIGGLLAYTRSLGACIIMHATTNLLLGAYVLWRQDWAFW